jgi:hypothetical protein
VYIGFLILERPWFSKDGSWISFLPTFLIHFFLMVLVVYGNTLVLIPFLLQKKKTTLYIVCIILLITLCTLLRSAYHKYIYEKIYDVDNITGIGTDYWESFVYATWFAVVSSMLFITQKWFDQKQQVKNIQISQLQTELKYLRAQVNPHFLFNGLNTIYGYIDMSNQQARDILLQFSDLLRYNLYEADVDAIDISKEAVYLQNYVALQRARSNDNLLIELEVSIENEAVKVAPLIFIVFVENAFKFSTRDDNTANYIKIVLRQKGDLIVFECSNSYDNTGQEVGGIGLNNVTRRLELLYKDRHVLTIKKEKTVYSVQLILNV